MPASMTAASLVNRDKNGRPKNTSDNPRISPIPKEYARLIRDYRWYFSADRFYPCLQEMRQSWMPACIVSRSWDFLIAYRHLWIVRSRRPEPWARALHPCSSLSWDPACSGWSGCILCSPIFIRYRLCICCMSFHGRSPQWRRYFISYEFTDKKWLSCRKTEELFFMLL